MFFFSSIFYLFYSFSALFVSDWRERVKIAAKQNKTKQKIVVFGDIVRATETHQYLDNIGAIWYTNCAKQKRVHAFSSFFSFDFTVFFPIFIVKTIVRIEGKNSCVFSCE